MLPSRDFFRNYYDDLTIKFDYHVNFQVSEEEENNDFNIKIKLELDEVKLIDLNIAIKFTSEMSGRLSAKYKFDISPEFSYLIAKKQLEEPKDEESKEITKKILMTIMIIMTHRNYQRNIIVKIDKDEIFKKI
jgi:hypothetical protein